MKKIFIYSITVIGVAIFFWSCSILKQSRDASHWPQAPGQMISSSLTINHYLPEFLNLSNDPLRWYGTEVEYEYFVHGNEYFSHRLSFQNNDTREPKEALRALNQYRKHPDILVHYNPQNPMDAVLEPEDIGNMLIPLMTGTMLVLIGLFAFANQSLEFNRGIDSYMNQGQIYQEQGKTQEALWQYTQVISINPHLAEGYSRRGEVYCEREDWDRAIADFNRALAIDTGNALVYFTLAKAYIGKGSYEKAWENMHKAMDKGFSVRPELLEKIQSKLI